MNMLILAVCSLNNGNCGDALCRPNDNGEPECYCEDGKTYVEPIQECVKCQPGFKIDMLTGECTSM